MAEWIIFNVIVLLCVVSIMSIGVWALRRNTPMHFWSGVPVKSEKVTDIKKYNRANAIMWFCYCIPFVISMVVAPFSVEKAGVIVGVGATVGLAFLIFTYEKLIKSKYFK